MHNKIGHCSHFEVFGSLPLNIFPLLCSRHTVHRQDFPITLGQDPVPTK